MPSLIGAWEQFKAERAIALHATSLESDYKQASKWLAKCPVQDHYCGITEESEMPVI